MRCEIVRYRPELEGGVAELQTRLWSRDPAVNAAYLRWKYERNPYADEPLIWVALCDGEVVGMRGLFGVRWEAGTPARRFAGLYATDLTVLPGHRNRGLFTRIMQAAIDDLAGTGHEWLFNLSAKPVTRLGSLAQGWRSSGPVERMRRPASRLRLFVRRALRKLPSLPNKLPALSRIKGPPPFHLLDKHGSRPGRERGITLSARPRPGAMAGLVERIGHDGRIRHVRDRRYFEWRFDNPLSEYRFLFLGGDELEGYLILQSKPRVRNVSANLIDWEATDPEVAGRLLRAAISWGRFTLIETWSGSLPDWQRTLLQDSGFTPVPSRGLQSAAPTILVRPLTPLPDDTTWTLNGRPLLELSHWSLPMLPTDTY